MNQLTNLSNFKRLIVNELLIYIIKQDIRIYKYVAYKRPNGWTDWTEFFSWHSLAKKIILNNNFEENKN